MPVDQMLRNITSWMGVPIYPGRCFQALFLLYIKLPIVSIVRIQVQSPVL